MTERLKPTMVQLSPSMLARLDERTAAEGRSRSALVRDAITAFLDAWIDEDLERRYRRAYADGSDIDAWGNVQAWHDALAAERTTTSTS